ncbi:MAG: Tim44 domain-containing protein [Deltaproteobacteria bacterium]|nr:Tim44 domain-containing protein [Deltaproteobacteria bacterium]
MGMLNRKLILPAIFFLAFAGLAQVVLESYADARAGGGRSGGSRGSRSFQAPSRQAQPSPSQPRREAAAPQQPGPMAPQPGGFMRGIGTAILGGFLGSMLFSGLAHAGIGGLGGSGFGMIEILLLAGLGYFLYRKFRSPAVATGYGSMQYQNTQPYMQPAPEPAPIQQAPSFDQIDYRSLTMLDRSFNPEQFLKSAQDTFFKVQGAWNKQDTAALGALCGSELMKTWGQEINELRSRGQQNKMENIALRESEITEAWTESGEDFITVRIKANLLDYTVDHKTGAVISGSNSEAVEFEEYWTFTRPVGPNSWKLGAVQQA